VTARSVADGLVVVDKPGGMTSHDVVARTRRALGTRKVGHAGTLDPMATGVLVLGVNRATRLLGHLMLTEKAYDATIRLGASTTTDDAEGEVVATASTGHLTEDEVRTALGAFVGEIDQKPTAVSAIKVDGKRAYQRVRDGEDVDLPARRVTVHALEVTDVRGADIDVSLRCSSGTYVRAIARDLGAALGVGGHLVALRRTAVGPFDLSVARTLEDLADDPSVLPIADAARASFPAVDLGEEDAVHVRVGRPLGLALPGTGEHALFAPDGSFLALYEPSGAGARPVAVFVG
jgi:tRNA pseudouridine55 synthase